MKVNFKTNPDIPFGDIHDSMQLDSGTVIATLEVGDYRLKEHVVGDVRVFWNADPARSWEDEGTETYRHASQMPEELLQILGGDKHWSDYTNLHVVNNNWFEVTVRYKGIVIHSDLDDIDTPDPRDLFTSLWDMYLEFKKDEQQFEKEHQKRTKDIPADKFREEPEDIPAYHIIDGLKKGPMSEEDVHDLLIGTLYDRWDYPIGRLNDLHYKYDARDGRNGGLIGA